MTSAIEAPQRMTTEQAAAYMGLAVPTLESWRCRRQNSGLAYIKVGRKVYYMRGDIDAWLASRRVGGLSAQAA
jgi:excisionase family DNA binding protein